MEEINYHDSASSNIDSYGTFHSLFEQVCQTDRL